MDKRQPMSKGGIISLVIIGVLAVIIAAMLINNGLVSKRNHKSASDLTEAADIIETTEAPTEEQTEVTVPEEDTSETTTEAASVVPDETEQTTSVPVETASANITIFSSKGVRPNADTDTTLHVAANGVSDSAEYKFLVHNEATDEWYIIRDFSQSDTTVWNTGGAGRKTIYVDVKSNGRVVRQSLEITVK